MAKKQHTKKTKYQIYRALDDGRALNMILDAYDAAEYDNTGIVEIVKGEAAEHEMTKHGEMATGAIAAVISAACTGISMRQSGLVEHIRYVADRASMESAIAAGVMKAIRVELEAIYAIIDG